MTNPTGAFVYDIPETAPRLDGWRSKAEERNANVLGKAVHPAALARLHELWPRAKVFVRHHLGLAPIRRGEFGQFDKRIRKITTVSIVKLPDDPDSPQVSAVSMKHPKDRWERRRGIDLAFRRALRRVRFVESE